MVTTCFCLQPTSHINKGQSHNKGQGESHNKDYTKGQRSRSRSSDGRHLGFVALNSHIYG